LLRLAKPEKRHKMPLMKAKSHIMLALRACCLALVAFLNIPSAVRGQAHTLRFETLSVGDGLSQSAVLAILQDQQGFMWFGTEDGLNRYDGYTFTVYKHDPDDPTTPSDDYISTIYEDRRGELWIGTRSGLDRLDRVGSRFIRYSHDPRDPQSLSGKWVTAIFEDRDGGLWVGTDEGLNALDPTTGAFTHYLHNSDDPASLSDDLITAIYGDRDGALWIGTSGGLDRLLVTTGDFAHYRHDPGDSGSLGGNRVSAILEDSQGLLWVATEDGGLDQRDRSSETFVHHRYDPEDPGSLVHNRVRVILEDSRGRLWVGTQNGLDLYNRDRNQFTHYQHSASDPYSLSSNAVWAIHEDQAGLMWFGTYGGGLSKYNPTTDQFTLYRHNPDLPGELSDNMVWSIYEDGNRVLWIGTFNGGLNRLDRESGAFAVYRHDSEDPSSLGSDDVRAILEDRQNGLWVGTSEGLDCLDRASGTFTHYRHDPDDLQSLSDDRVVVLHEDRLGNLWVGTRSGGLNRLDRLTGDFVRYQSDPENDFSLSDDRVWALYGDSFGRLWVGTLRGVNVWDPANDQFTRYLHDPEDPQSLSNDGAFSFHEDASGAIWIGTWGGGLNRFDRATKAFSHYTEKDGLANDVVYGIESDSEGFLWLSTNAGLSRFSSRSGTFQNFDVSDGLQDNEFNAGAHFRSDSGEMFFGGIGGFNAFHPDRVTGNVHIPPIAITAFSKFNEVVRADLSPDEHLRLSYRDSFVSFEFAALDYAAAERNQYAYMLEGQDKDWVRAGTRRHADYTNLRGGNYVFRVKGSNNDGVWNEEGIAVRVTVTPPYWERWWFRGTAILVLVGSMVGGYLLRVRSVEERSHRLERQVRERTRELSTLLEVSHNVASTLELESLLGLILDQLGAVVDYGGASIVALEEGTVSVLAHRGRGLERESRRLSFPLEEAAVPLEVVRRREPVTISDLRSDTPLANAFQALAAEHPELVSADTRCWMGIPLIVKERVIGMLNLEHDEPGYYTPRQSELVLAFAAQVAVALENARLYEQAQELAVVEERQRLARDLHDAVTQTLFSASLIAEVLPRLWVRNPEEGSRRLSELRELNRGTLAEMRTLLLELRPSALIEADLQELLRQLAESVTGRARVPIALEIEGQCILPVGVKVVFYRIAQEALNNVAKHAAAGNGWVSLHCQPGRAELHIRDDGCGFNRQDISSEHLGLGIMQERAEAIGAQLSIESEIGHGTEVSIVWSEGEGRPTREVSSVRGPS
jgi:ligand-binding sensor domain-containing protein/signal transduction histidine kinase